MTRAPRTHVIACGVLAIDIRRAAKLLFDRYGDEAPKHTHRASTLWRWSIRWTQMLDADAVAGYGSQYG